MATKTRASRGDGEKSDKSGGRGGEGATGLVTFLVGVLIAAYLFFTNPDPKSPEAYWLVNTALCLWVPLVVILLGLRAEPSQFGMTRGDRRLGLKWTGIAWGVMVLLLAVAVSIPSFHAQFQQQYLYGRLSRPLEGVGQPFVRDFIHPALGHVNLKALLYYELAMGFYMFCWEFFFRGFLLFGLQKSRLGAWGAVIVQALLFALLHWSYVPFASKPPVEVLSALPGGLILGVLALRTRSFVYGFLAHWAISLTLDLILLAPFIFRHFG
jgi:membrane protease YdiL (CAAX protease family)